MKKINLMILTVLLFLNAKGQPFYQDNNIKLEAFFNMKDSSILLKITNTSKKTIYLHNRDNQYVIDQSLQYYLYYLCLKGDPVNYLKPWVHESMNFRRIPPLENDSIKIFKAGYPNSYILNLDINDSIKISKMEFDTISTQIEIETFKFIVIMEYLLLPNHIYIHDRQFRNDKFLRYLKKRRYKIHEIETPILIIDNSIQSIIRPIIKQ